jgi:hypothetical protein
MRIRLYSCSLLLVILIFAGCAGAPKDLPMDPSAVEPPVVFEMPEIVCVAEKQGIAFVPDLPIDIFHYDNVWFWKIRDTWYWSKHYMGMLYELAPKQVPKTLHKFGEEYRETLPDCKEYTYEDWNRRANPR